MISRFAASVALLAALFAPAASQEMPASLEIKSDTRPGALPSITAPGEIAINRADGRFFYRDEAGNRAGGLLPDLDANGYLKFRNGMILGRNVNGDLIPQPKRIEIQGAGSTGDVSIMSVTPGGGGGAPTALSNLLTMSPAYSIKCNSGGATAFAGNCTRFLMQDQTSTPDEGYTASIQRISTYSGGKSGHENTALRVINQVSANNANYEDAGLFILNTYHNTAAQNVAVRAQANKFGTGTAWSLANEAIDHTGVANPTSGLIGIEQVVAGNGTDNLDNRVVYDAVGARPQDGPGGAYSGAAVEIGTGFRVVRQLADSPGMARFKAGMTFGTASAPTDFDRAIDLRYATFGTGGYAIAMGTGQRISLETGGGRTLDWTGGALSYRVDGNPVVQVSDNGGISSTSNFIRVAFASTPASSTAPCNAGTIQWDTNYLYVCVAANTWKRSALSSW